MALAVLCSSPLIAASCQVLACLHHGFMNLEEHWMKRAVKRLFTVPGVKPPITPHEFLAFVTAQVQHSGLCCLLGLLICRIIVPVGR